MNNEKTQQRLFFSVKRKWRKWWLKDERKWKKTTLPSEILKVQFSSVNCLTVRFGFRKVKCKIEVKWLSSIYIKKNLPGLYGTRQFLRTLFHWSPYLNHISAYKLTIASILVTYSLSIFHKYNITNSFILFGWKKHTLFPFVCVCFHLTKYLKREWQPTSSRCNKNCQLELVFLIFS